MRCFRKLSVEQFEAVVDESELAADSREAFIELNSPGIEADEVFIEQPHFRLNEVLVNFASHKTLIVLPDFAIAYRKLLIV